MTGKKYFLLLIATIIAGLIGGALASKIFTARTAIAQESEEATDIKRLRVGELKLVDENGKTRALLEMSTYGSPKFQLYDRDGKSRAELSLLHDGTPNLLLYDKNGHVRAAVGGVETEISTTGEVKRRPESSMTLFDSNGKLIWAVPTQ